jgi:ADP-ribose pyrophosphatase YjhB (NUDIX family)
VGFDAGMALNTVKHDAAVVLDDLDGLARGLWQGGIERPLNGLSQFATNGQVPELHVFETDSNAHGLKAFMQSAGSAAGVIFDFAVLSKLSASAVEASGLAATSSVGGRLAATALTGFAYGAVLTPLKPGESQSVRVANGLTTAASFLAFDGLSAAIGSQIAAPTFLNSVLKGGLSGFGAGMVNANMESLTHGHGLATGQKMLKAGEAWGTGAAVMGGLGYLWSKIGANSDQSTEPKTDKMRNLQTADGQDARVSYTQLADGQQRIDKVELANGTKMVRAADGSWISNEGTPQFQVWRGDVQVDAGGKLNFIYKFEKAPSVVTLDVRLPDGSRLSAINQGGETALPATTLDATRETLSDAALNTLKRLNLDIPRERLALDGVSTSSSVNTRFAVQLTTDEAAQLRQSLASQAGFKIVSLDQAGDLAGKTPVLVDGGAGENQSGTFTYGSPMADHTSTVAYLFKGDDARWKVLTGLRKVAPEAGREALPGGFLDIKGRVVEDPADAAAREVMEETGLHISRPTLVRIGDAFNRDIRNRIIDFQYGVLGNKQELAKLFAGDDLGSLDVKDVEQLLADPRALAFDHHQALQAAYDSVAKMLASATPPPAAR